MKKSNLLLSCIFVALIAIFGFLVYQHEQEPTLGDTVNEFTEEVGDEIDDATNN